MLHESRDVESSKSRGFCGSFGCKTPLLFSCSRWRLYPFVPHVTLLRRRQRRGKNAVPLCFESGPLSIQSVTRSLFVCAQRTVDVSLFLRVPFVGVRPSCRLSPDLVWRAGGTFEFPRFTYRYLLLSVIFESEDVTAETAGKSSRALYFPSLFLCQKTKTKQTRIKKKKRGFCKFFCFFLSI